MVEASPTPAGGADATGSFACVAAAWDAHSADLLGFLKRRLRDSEAASDVLHDVFVSAMRQGQGFCRLDSPRAWLFQLARNAVVDRARSSRPTGPLPDVLTAPEPPEPAPVDALSGCLARCVTELDSADAEVLRVCDLEGRTVRAFAEDHGLTLAAAKSRLLRARQRLRARLVGACQVRVDEDGRVSGHVPRESTGSSDA